METISIHAPREGSDVHVESESEDKDAFLSTLPARGATQSKNCKLRIVVISIHAPREGSDL